MAKTTFVGTAHIESTTTELTQERAEALLNTKNAKRGDKRYLLFGFIPANTKGVGKFAYVLAKVKSNGTNAEKDGYKHKFTWPDGTKSFVGSVFWADGDTLRPCSKSSHPDKYTRVREYLRKNSDFQKFA